MSDEQANQGSAPDGGDPGQSPANTLAQAEERRAAAVTQRREMGTRLDASLDEGRLLREENAKLREQLEGNPPKAKPAPASKPDTGSAPEWALELAASVAGLGSQFEELKTGVTGAAGKTKRSDAIKSVMAQVPDGNRKAAELTIAGLEAQGLKLDTEGGADALLSAIHEHTPHLLRDPNRPSAKIPPQVAPDGKTDWSRYKSIEEVPKALYASMPDADWQRLRGGSASAGRKMAL